MTNKTLLFPPVQQQQEAVEGTIRNGIFKAFVDITGTPKALPRVRLVCGSAFTNKRWGLFLFMY